MRLSLAAIAMGLALWFASAGGANAQGADVQIKDAWARATPGAAQTAAAYVTIVSTTGDRLTAVSTPVAQKADLHSMTMDGSVMKMRQVDAIDLPAGRAVTLKPGGYHIMLSGLAKPLKDGETFPLTLTFDKAGTRDVIVAVQKAGATAPGNMPGMDMPMHH